MSIDTIRAAVLAAWLADSGGRLTAGGVLPTDQNGQLDNLAYGVAAGVVTGSAGLADPGGNGIVVRTAENVTTARSIAAGSGVSVSNGSGVSGSPTVSLASIAQFSVLGRAASGSGVPAAIALGADEVLGRSGSGNVGGITVTAAGRALIDDASALAQRNTLGLGLGDTPGFAGLDLFGSPTSNIVAETNLYIGADLGWMTVSAEAGVLELYGGTGVLARAPSGSHVLVGHDGDTTGKKALAGDWTATDATDDGLAGARTSGATFQVQTAVVLPRGVVELDAVKWDVTAGTYTLVIDGTSHGSQTRASTGTLTWSTGGQVIQGAAHFALTRSSAAAQVRDADAGAPYLGDLVILPSRYVYDTLAQDFRPAIRVSGRSVRLSDFVGLS